MNLRSSVSLARALAVACALAATEASALEVCPASVDTSCPSGCDFEVPILVSDFTTVDAVGLEFDYEQSAGFVGWRRGNLVRAWQTFDLSNIFSGHFRLGGFDSQGSAASGSDTLVVFVFHANTNICMSYHTEAFVDDFASAAPCSGSARVSVDQTASGLGAIAVHPHESTQGCCFDILGHTVLEVWAEVPGLGEWAGAEFRIEVHPPVPGATLVWQPSGGVTSVGDPIDNSDAPNDVSGVLVRFACRSHSEGRILLGTVAVDGLTESRDLLVKRHNQPADPFACANFITCGACSTSACMFSPEPDAEDPIVYRARINDACAGGGVCVAVAPRTWSDLKRLYR